MITARLVSLIAVLMSLPGCKPSRRTEPAQPATPQPTAVHAAADPELDARVQCPEGTTQKRYATAELQGAWCVDQENRRHGFDRAWWVSTGNLSWEQHYIHGRLTGAQRDWYPTGQLQGVSSCREGKLDGVLRVYYEDGKLQHEAFHENGRRTGVWRWWDERGRLRKRESHGKGLNEPLDDC